jgi:hypothetical protein
MPRLSPDATIADIMSSLAQPEDYLRRVIGTMIKMKKVHGEVIVRIGVTGKGKMPHFRIDDPTGKPIQAFDYLGEPFTEYRAVDTKAWSTQTMTYDAVRSLLADHMSAKLRGHA